MSDKATTKKSIELLDSIDFNKFKDLYKIYLEPTYEGKLKFDNQEKCERVKKALSNFILPNDSVVKIILGMDFYCQKLCNYFENLEKIVPLFPDQILEQSLELYKEFKKNEVVLSQIKKLISSLIWLKADKIVPLILSNDENLIHTKNKTDDNANILLSALQELTQLTTNSCRNLGFGPQESLVNGLAEYWSITKNKTNYAKLCIQLLDNLLPFIIKPSYSEKEYGQLTVESFRINERDIIGIERIRSKGVELLKSIFIDIHKVQPQIKINIIKTMNRCATRFENDGQESTLKYMDRVIYNNLTTLLDFYLSHIDHFTNNELYIINVFSKTVSYFLNNSHISSKDKFTVKNKINKIRQYCVNNHEYVCYGLLIYNLEMNLFWEEIEKKSDDSHLFFGENKEKDTILEDIFLKWIEELKEKDSIIKWTGRLWSYKEEYQHHKRDLYLNNLYDFLLKIAEKAPEQAWEIYQHLKLYQLFSKKILTEDECTYIKKLYLILLSVLSGSEISTLRNFVCVELESILQVDIIFIIDILGHYTRQKSINEKNILLIKKLLFKIINIALEINNYNILMKVFRTLAMIYSEIVEYHSIFDNKSLNIYIIKLLKNIEKLPDTLDKTCWIGNIWSNINKLKKFVDKIINDKDISLALSKNILYSHKFFYQKDQILIPIVKSYPYDVLEILIKAWTGDSSKFLYNLDTDIKLFKILKDSLSHSEIFKACFNKYKTISIEESVENKIKLYTNNVIKLYLIINNSTQKERVDNETINYLVNVINDVGSDGTSNQEILKIIIFIVNILKELDFNNNLINVYKNLFINFENDENLITDICDSVDNTIPMFKKCTVGENEVSENETNPIVLAYKKLLALPNLPVKAKQRLSKNLTNTLKKIKDFEKEVSMHRDRERSKFGWKNKSG